MDLLQVGAHCSLPSCNLNDFLPITCRCKSVFCRDHISPESHACSAVAPAYEPGTASEADGLEKLRRCEVEGCSKPSLFAYTTDPGRETCDKCHKAFCVDHRYLDTHECTPTASDVPEMGVSAARALLQKNFGSKLGSSSSSSSTTSKGSVPLKAKKPPTDPVKLAQYNKVQLMKMKHSAVPADPKDTPGSVPQSLRLIVKVVYGEAEKAVWFRNSISTGKAVDLLKSHIKVSSTSLMKLVKHGPNDEVVPLRNDVTLAEQATDGETLIIQSD